MFFCRDGDQDYQQQEIETSQFLLQSGEDRGARIDITGSTFKHSRFCKGLISYRKMQKIEFSEEPQFIKLTSQVARHDDYKMGDNREEPFIRIKDSTFENLSYQQLISTLTNKNVN